MRTNAGNKLCRLPVAPGFSIGDSRVLVDDSSRKLLLGDQLLAFCLSEHYLWRRSSVAVSFCIERDYVLLHRDRDFDVFEQLRGLRGWRH